MGFRSFGVAASIAIAGALCACSSTSSGSSAHDRGAGVSTEGDSGSGDDTAADSGALTVGNACTKDTDCNDDGGATGGICSSDAYTDGPVFPSPICIAPCAVASASEVTSCGNGTGFCQPPSSGTVGTCLPVCTLTSAGATSGCLANDVCQVLGVGADPTTGVAEGLGYCQPGCTSDLECPSGSKCDTYAAACVTTVTPPTQEIGTSCDPASSAPPCPCLGVSSTTGFCTSTCVTGSACPQPIGGGAGAEDGGVIDSGASDAAGSIGSALPFVCSAELGGINALDAGISFTTQPSGLYGICLQACDTTAECAIVAAGTTCNPDPAGGTHLGICAPPPQ